MPSRNRRGSKNDRDQDVRGGHGDLVRYDAMCRAIEAAYQVDEVKEIRDKALAFEAYARQAKNTEAERCACEIRLRAERKAGALLAEREKRQGQRTDLVARRDQVEPVPTLRDLGVSKDQSSKWQKLAAVPQEQFEAALAAPEKPSTTGIIGRKPGPMDPHALWLWGRLRDFERDGILDRRVQEVFAEMTDTMAADVRRLAPIVSVWLEGLHAS